MLNQHTVYHNESMPHTHTHTNVAAGTKGKYSTKVDKDSDKMSNRVNKITMGTVPNRATYSILDISVHRTN